MHILVTGATGFIGQHVVPKLLKQGHKVIATSLSEKKAKKMDWFNSVEYFEYDIHTSPEGFIENVENINAVIHLAWKGLPNYKSLFHFEDNLLADYRFIKELINLGIKHVLITGTCFEYGMKCGSLSEDMLTMPQTAYAIAKDTLRKFLQQLQQVNPFVLQWVRLFYMYGEGQNANSLLAQLDRAIDNNERVFNMSGGEQLRDYMPVENVADFIVDLIEEKTKNGLFNCCSGQPISVRKLVENRIKERKTRIKINLGYYPYPEYEPMAFWGNRMI